MTPEAEAARAELRKMAEADLLEESVSKLRATLEAHIGASRITPGMTQAAEKHAMKSLAACMKADLQAHNVSVRYDVVADEYQIDVTLPAPINFIDMRAEVRSDD